MSRHALRHRATPPLEETAWLPYVLLCSAKGKRANKFEFINWLVARVRPYSQRGVDVESMKAEILKAINDEIALLAPDSAIDPARGAAYLAMCAAGVAQPKGAA